MIKPTSKPRCYNLQNIAQRGIEDGVIIMICICSTVLHSNAAFFLEHISVSVLYKDLLYIQKRKDYKKILIKVNH